MRVLLPASISLLVLGLTACVSLRPSPRSAQALKTTYTSQPPAQKLRPALEPPHFVLLRADARLHRFAHTGATPGHAKQRVHAHAPGAVFVYRLVADHGAWLELESLPKRSGPAHCHDADPRLLGLRLRLFVHRRDLADLTLTPVTQHYPDGTSLRLAAGAGLSPPLSFAAPKGERIRHLQVEGLALNAEIPEISVGSAYAPAPLPDARSSRVQAETLTLLAGTILHFGLGAKVRVERALDAEVIGTASGQRRLRSSSTCLELVSLLGAEDRPAPGGAPSPHDPPEEGTAPAPAGSVAPGTQLFWPGGKLAGMTSDLVGFDRLAAPDAGRTCLSRSVPIWPGGATAEQSPAPLRLCVTPSAVLDAGSLARDE